MAKKNYSRTAFLASLAFVVFVYGVAVGRYQIFPYSVLDYLHSSFVKVFKEREMVLALRPVGHLHKIRYPGEDVTQFDADRMAPGLTFITRFYNDKNEMRLIRPDGSLVNQWFVSFLEVFPNPTHIKPKGLTPRSDWHSMVHGALLLPDGSAVFNFDYNGMVKMDRCGKVIWALPIMSHHSLELAEDGSFWVPGRRYVESEPKFLPVGAPYLEDMLLNISADGEILTEISVPSLLIDNDLLRSIYLSDGQLNIGVKQFWFANVSELVHLNDIEELGSKFAGRFPQFKAGDLLISLRNRHLIMVVDPGTRTVKWHQTGPWIRQHDPDFTSRGTISIFNNNTDMTTSGEVFGGSNIMDLDPASRHVNILYGGKQDQKMYTGAFGKHQVIETDKGENVLITETEGGRILEIDSTGNIAWEFINKYDDQDVAKITQAIRYPTDYFQLQDWSCQ